jgi:hypothetical protein
MDDKQALQTVKNDLSWLQRHERIVIVFLILLVSGWLGNKWLNDNATGDKVKVALLEQQSAAQQSQNAQTASQYQAMVSTLTGQINSLAASMAQRNVALVTQQTVDKTLPLPDLAKRWEALADLQVSDLTATDAGITVNDTAARATVDALEELPTLRANLVSETQIAQYTGQELTKANSLISGLNSQIALDDKTHKAEIASVKADARKSKRSWFIAGFVTGIATRIFLKF